MEVLTIAVGPRSKPLDLSLDGRPIIVVGGGGKVVILEGALNGKASMSGWTSGSNKADVGEKIAEQLEPLLCLAHKLGLEQLQEKLHRFIHANCNLSRSPLDRFASWDAAARKGHGSFDGKQFEPGRERVGERRGDWLNGQLGCIAGWLAR